MRTKRLAWMAVGLGWMVFGPVSGFAGDSQSDLAQKAGLQALPPSTAEIDFRLQDLGGSPHQLSDFKGKVVVLNFWASWCEPCRREMPSLESLYDTYRDRGLVVVAVDVLDPPSSAQAFVRQFGFAFPVLVDRSGGASGSYGARALPTTYVVGKDGVLDAREIGGRDWGSPAARAYIEALLAQS